MKDVYHVRYHDARIAELRSTSVPGVRGSGGFRVATSAGTVPTVVDDEG